jgi:type I restriction enzyme S subunit
VSFPRYPAYKPSEAKNIDSLPDHWGELPLKRLFRLEKREPLVGDDIVTAFRDGKVTLRKNRREEGFTNAIKEIGYQRIRRGDLVISAMDAFAGAIGVSDSDGKSSPVYSACTSIDGAVPRFYAYYLRDLAMRGFIESLAKGIRERSTDFRWSDAAMVIVPIPLASEQNIIATFLDHETAKIDALIAEQQRLIKLLQEKRQAVISHAVTKGLNPDAPMKDSGVEWLGEVPEDWEVCRVKAVSVFTTSGPRGWSERVGDMGAFFVQSGDLTDAMEVDFENCKRVQIVDDAEAARTKLLDGDLVVCITGAKTGNVAVCESVHEASYVNQHLCLIRPGQRVHPRFLATLLKSDCGQTYFSLAQYGLKQGLSLEDVREAPVVLPPPDEQDRIIKLVKGVSSRYLPLEAESQRTISLLQERRSALISAAVTGQIDVRGLVPNASAA